MLEIKIKQVDKVLTTQEKRKEFLLKELTVTEKVDGVRLQLIRNNEDYDADFTKNWIVMYKGFVLYDNEFNNLDTEEIKSYSNGITQYRFIFDLLEKIHPNASSIGKNTEFLFEFIMKKNTLTRQYKKYWDLVLLGYSKITYTEIDGVIRSFPEELNQGNLLVWFSSIFKCKIRNKIFEGILYPKDNFVKGINSNKLLDSFLKNKELLDTDDINNYYDSIKKIFLETESTLGNKSEGVVLEGINILLKITQKDQYDKLIRNEIKKRWKHQNEEDEIKYWNEVHKISDGLLSYTVDMKDLFNHSKVIFMNQYSITHEKKNTFQINEDIYTTLRIGLIKKLNSNYSLIIAKMRIPTLAHFELIEKALENHKGVIIALTKNIVPFEIRKKIIEERFKDKVQVYEFNSGAIKTILREVPFGINEIFCGSDRIEDYQKQHEIKVTELIRSNHISSTLVQFCIENDNKLSFDSFTPLETQKYWNTFKEIYKKG